MNHHLRKTVIFSCLLILFIICLNLPTIAAESSEDVHVEKESRRTSPSTTDSTSSSSSVNINNEKIKKRKSKKNIWKKMMKELSKYKDSYEDDWFDNRWVQPQRNELFNDFDNMFSNFDQSMNNMRKMNKVMSRTNMFPSLTHDDQWWEDYTNSFNSMSNKKGISSSSSSTSSSSMSETSNSLSEMKHREPISSVIRTTHHDGKKELSVEVNNIPRDVFEKKDIEVKIKENSFGDLITISGEKKTENGHFKFSKSFTFPKNSLDLDKVKATLSDDGTLSVKIPKIEEPTMDRIKEISIE